MKEKKFKLLALPSVTNMQQVIDRFSFPVELFKGHFRYLEIIFKEDQVKVLYRGADIRDFSFVWLCSSWSSRDLAYAVRLYLKKTTFPILKLKRAPRS